MYSVRLKTDVNYERISNTDRYESDIEDTYKVRLKKDLKLYRNIDLKLDPR